MLENVFTNYDELPLFLNAQAVGKLLGISRSASYELMHEKDFPTLHIGSRIVVPKQKLIEWINSVLRCKYAGLLNLKSMP